MWLLVLLSTIGVSSPPAEPPLPASLALELLDPAPPERPEVDPFWPFFRIEKADFGDYGEFSSALFRWPEIAARQDAEPLRAPVGERWDAGYLCRIELGLERVRALELEPRFFPAVSRAVLGVPMGLLEGLMELTVPNVVIVNGKQVLNQVDAEDDLATTAGRTLLKAEMNFLGSLRSSSINTAGVQNGTEDFDRDRLLRLQWRALFNGMKNAYRERYEIPSLDIDTILTAVSTGDWMDFVIVPAAVSIYAARFGIDRRVKLGDDFRLELQIEKATRFQKVLTSDHGGRLVSASLNAFQLPVSIIVSLDAAPGGVAFGFIGIGTDINAALCAVANFEDPRSRR